MLRKNILKIGLAVVAMLSPISAMAQHYRYSEIPLSIPNGSLGFSVGVGETANIYLPRNLYVHKVILKVDSVYGHAGADLYVNGDKKGNIYVSPTDPVWTVTVAQVTNVIQVFGIPAISWPQGRFNVRAAWAIVSDVEPVYTPSYPSSNATNVTQPIVYGAPVYGSLRLPYPGVYRSDMANVANRAITLVDRLSVYTNYPDLGLYLLPIKKAAAEARAIAEAQGPASSAARPYYVAFLQSLDAAELYLSDTFERSAVFPLATELLSLRAYLREILD